VTRNVAGKRHPRSSLSTRSVRARQGLPCLARPCAFPGRVPGLTYQLPLSTSLPRHNTNPAIPLGYDGRDRLPRNELERLLIRLRPPQGRGATRGKGKEAKLSYMGNALTENRHGLVVEAELGSATGNIEAPTSMHQRRGALHGTRRGRPGSERFLSLLSSRFCVHEGQDREFAAPVVSSGTRCQTSFCPNSGIPR
jgi:hypothetical protein